MVAMVTAEPSLARAGGSNCYLIISFRQTDLIWKQLNLLFVTKPGLSLCASPYPKKRTKAGRGEDNRIRHTDSKIELQSTPTP